jgi:Protein of unknown function (DUF4038)/Putative collagen-binding domain of a collagenase
MAVTFDTVSSSGGAEVATPGPLQWNHTCGASATLLVVSVSLGASSDTNDNLAATYNGVSMTAVPSSLVHTNNGTVGYLQSFYLLNPPTGSALQVSVSKSGAGSFLTLAGASISYNGAGTPGTATTAVGSGTSAAVTQSTSASSSMIHGAVADGSGSTSVASPFTSRFINNTATSSGAGCCAAATAAGSAGSVTQTWTISSDFWGAHVFEIPVGSVPLNTVYPSASSNTFSLTRQPGHVTEMPALMQVANPPATLQGVANLVGAAIVVPNSEPPFITGVASKTGTSYFIDSKGKPRLVWGDAAWGFMGSAGRYTSGAWQSDIDNYLTARANQGFTVIYTEPMATVHVGGINDDGRTFDGLYPFQGGSNANPSTGLTDLYWQRIDYFFNSAINRGITVFFDAIGYSSDFLTNGPLAGKSDAEFQAFGAAVGARYLNQSNLIWVLADDYFGFNDDLLTAFLTGLQSVNDPHHISIEMYAETTSRFDMSNNAALAWGTSNANFNFVYSYEVIYYGVEYAYLETNPITVLAGDGYFYDGVAADERAFRQESWWALSSGARGKVHGSENIWNWPSSAETDYSNSATQPFYTTTAGAIRTAYEALPGWHLLIPDTSSQLVTAGRGTRATFSSAIYEPKYTDNYVTASKTPDGRLAVIYMSHATTITIDETKMVGGYQAFWLDPATGTKTTTPTGPTYNSTAKGNNSAGDPDWVLVLQANLGASGYPTLPVFSEIRQPNVISSRPKLPGPVTAQTIDSTGVSIVGVAALSALVTEIPAGVTVTAAATLTSPVVQGAGTTLTAAGTVSSAVVQGAGTTLTGAGTVNSAVVQGSGSTVTGAGSMNVVVTESVTASLSAAATLTSPVTQICIIGITAAGTVIASAGGTNSASITAAGSVVALATTQSTVSVTAAGTVVAPATTQATVAITAVGTLAALATIRATVAITAAATVVATGSVPTAVSRGSVGPAPRGEPGVSPGIRTAPTVQPGVRTTPIVGGQ